MLVGVAQIEPRLGEAERNLELCLAQLERATGGGCDLLVLPECALTGYVCSSPAEAAGVALEVPGPEVEQLETACRRLGIHVVCGLIESDGDRIRNCALLLGPGGLVGRYWKTHLPYLGVDRFVTPGDGPFEPLETPLGSIGLEICYDLRFPEVTRSLALAGADIVAHPTNWPVQARPLAEVITRARALENRVFLLTANRVGRERSAEFCGWSQIVSPTGSRLAEADEASETLLVAEIDVGEARVKDLIPEPGEYEMRLFDHRRPDLYGLLAAEPRAVNRR
jgi:predicted amidohydrolase